MRALDPMGVSMYLKLGHVLGEHTLRQGIHVVPAGQRWRINARHPSIEKECYYGPAQFAGNQSNRSVLPHVAELAEALQRPLRTLGSHFDSLVCPLTGGKDSRLVAALLLNAGLDARYFTFGNGDGDDARIRAKHC